MYKSICAALAMTAAVSTAAIAAGPLQVVSKILVEQRVRAADGSTSIVMAPAKKVVPGDRLVVVLAYRNTGKQAINGLVLNNPVPQGVAYRGAASNSPVPEVSVDGTNYGSLASLRVRTASGIRAAGPDDVTAVRWRLAAALAAGAQGQLSFQAVLK